MGAPPSEVSYTLATIGRGDHEAYMDMWWHLGGGGGQQQHWVKLTIKEIFKGRRNNYKGGNGTQYYIVNTMYSQRVNVLKQL